jgi:hypothetical protein
VPDPTDRDKSIESDPIYPDPDPDPDPIHPQLPTIPNLIKSGIESLSSQIQLAPVDLTSRSCKDREQSIEPDPDPSLKYFTSLSLEQKLKLTAQEIKEIRLSDLPLVEGCLVRPFDIYHVHGADRGIVKEIQPWGVYVRWSDGTNGRYALDELICTHSPSFKG